MSASEAETWIRAFVAKEDDPRIEGPVVICSVDDLPPQAGLHMRELVNWHFRRWSKPGGLATTSRSSAARIGTASSILARSARSKNSQKFRSSIRG